VAPEEQPFTGPDSEDTLRRLEERLERASAAAERLMAHAEGVSGAGREPPPAGWQLPEDESSSRSRSELDALVALLQSFRDLIPPELQRRLVEAVRELLQAMRALIDWYLARLECDRGNPAEIQDIPIL
jgi:hypothetical protein